MRDKNPDQNLLDRLHNAELDPARTHSYSTEDTAYLEFQIKISRVREQMLPSNSPGDDTNSWNSFLLN